MKKLSKQVISSYFVFLAGKSKKSQIKKYGGKEGYKLEMQRRGGIRKAKKLSTVKDLQ